MVTPPFPPPALNAGSWPRVRPGRRQEPVGTRLDGELGNPLPPPAVTQTAPSATLVPLLAGYLSGDVSFDAMCQFDDLFEGVSVSASEREALAHFYLDALATGDYAHALPEVAEVAGILDAARA